jgi:outer membrane lipoprotein-sorting protein
MNNLNLKLNCYTFVEYNFNEGLFDKTIDATYIIHLENNGRFESVIKQLEEYKPTKKVYILYNKGYKSKYEGPTTEGNRVQDVIRLVPKKKANYAYLKLEIDNSNYKINKVIQHYKNGTEVSIELNKLTPNAALKDDFFQWTETGHDGVVVVDLTKSKKRK